MPLLAVFLLNLSVKLFSFNSLQIVTVARILMTFVVMFSVRGKDLSHKEDLSIHPW
jgi:hypothetical protein